MRRYRERTSGGEREHTAKTNRPSGKPASAAESKAFPQSNTLWLLLHFCFHWVGPVQGLQPPSLRATSAQTTKTTCNTKRYISFRLLQLLELLLINMLYLLFNTWKLLHCSNYTTKHPIKPQAAVFTCLLNIKEQQNVWCVHCRWTKCYGLLQECCSECLAACPRGWVLFPVCKRL